MKIIKDIREIIKRAIEWLDQREAPSRGSSFLAAILIVICIFPDVVFYGKTISMLDIVNITGVPRPKVSFYSERLGRDPVHGLSDHGGAAWQSEPSMNFMRYCIYNGDSPYWNPYSAGGSFGPETLVDIKFSPISIIVATAGGSIIAFHIVVLSLYVLACYFLLRLFTKYWHLSVLSAIAACFVYLLNGYFIANINSNVSQSILYYPLCLYALISFTNHPSSLKYIAIILTSSLILLTTFMPTTSLLFICVYFIAGIYAISMRNGMAAKMSILMFQWSAALLSFLLLAFLYFPIVESFSFINPFSMYGERVFYPASIKGFISIFTPKHFWESYLAMEEAAWSYAGNVIFHFGVVTSLISVQVLRKEYLRNNLIIALIAVIVMALGRIFDIPILSTIVGHLPFFGNIGEQYLWIAVSIAFTLMFPFGFEALYRMNVRMYPVIVVSLIIIVNLIYLYFNYGLTNNHDVNWFITQKGVIIYLLIIVILIVAAGTLLYIQRYSTQGRRIYFMIAITILIFFEMTFYMNSMRYARLDVFNNPPEYVKYLKERIGYHRIVNFGQYGIFAELGSAFQIQQIESMNMSIFPDYYTFFNRNFLTDNDRWGKFCSFRSQNDPPKINETILDMMGVRYILVSNYMDKYESFFKIKKYPMVFHNDQVKIFENIDCYKRIYAVQKIMEDDLTPDTKGYSPREVVFTKDRKMIELAAQNGVSSKWDENGKHNEEKDSVVDLKIYKNSRIKAFANLSAPSVIVMMDNWHPNWKAFANGKEVYIGKVNECFRGIVLPPGEYDIEFKYSPRTMPYAIVLTVTIMLGIITLFIYRKKTDQVMNRYWKNGE